MIAADTLYTAMTIYHEARGEPRSCQMLVADVIRNRMDKDDLSASEVVKARGQFSWIPLIRNKTIKTEYQRVSQKARNKDKAALEHAVLIAGLVLSKDYRPKNGLDSFHDRSVRVKKHGAGVTCGKLTFYKR